ncbi:MAG: VTT domain-containing protein [Asticcacaulis sp.]
MAFGMQMKLRQVWAKFWEGVSGFFTHLDAKAVRALWISVLLLALVVATFLIGKSEWGQAVTRDLEGWMAQYQHSPLAIVIVTIVFCVSALFGAPQFVLIAACVVAFGPVWGSIYSWFATLVSAAMTFYMGRFLGRFGGHGWLEKFTGGRLSKMTDYIGRNAFSASFIIRNLPSAPAIVVNMAFGASRAAFPGFILGCALGIIPKTVLVAMLGTSYSSLARGGNWKMSLLMAALALAWLGLMLLARRFYERGKKSGGESRE